MKTYKVVPLKTGFFTARLDHAQLEGVLNEHARAGWALRTTVKDETRGLLPGSRREVCFPSSNANSRSPRSPLPLPRFPVTQ